MDAATSQALALGNTFHGEAVNKLDYGDKLYTGVSTVFAELLNSFSSMSPARARSSQITKELLLDIWAGGLRY